MAATLSKTSRPSFQNWMLPVPVTKEGWTPPMAQEPFCSWWQASSVIRPREYSS